MTACVEKEDRKFSSERGASPKVRRAPRGWLPQLLGMVLSAWAGLSAPSVGANQGGAAQRDGDVIFAPDKSFSQRSLRSERSAFGADPGSDRSVIDVMVLYTDAARAKYGEAAVRTKIALGVACINEAFNRSGVNARFRLVYQAEATWHRESARAEDELYWLAEDDTVANLRDLVGADLVTLLVRSGLPNGGLAFFNSPFAVYDGGPVKFAHECGHNLGCNHDRPNAGDALDSPGFNFGYSFTPPGSHFNYGDVMSYVGSQIEQFSNPDRYFMGEATGLPAGHVDAAGVPDAADNVTSLNAYIPYAAGSKSEQATSLGHPRLDLDGAQFSFQIAGLESGDCAIDYSADLQEWKILTRASLNSDGSGVTEMLDDVASVSHRFYRARTVAGDLLTRVGFVKRIVPEGYSLLANPLENDDNTIGALLPSVPEGTQLYKWMEGKQTWVCNSFSLDGWNDPTMTLHPGEGVIIRNRSGAPILLGLVGEVNQALRNRVPLDWSIRSSAIPQAGPITSILGMRPFGAGCELFRIGPDGRYLVYSWDGDEWSPSEPSIEIGEAFWCRNSVNAFLWERCLWESPLGITLRDP